MDSASDFEKHHLHHAQIAVRFGMEPMDALRAITINPAEMLRVDDRVGSLTPGKDGDVVILDGDPMSTFSHVLYTIVEGKVEYERSGLSDSNADGWCAVRTVCSLLLALAFGSAGVQSQTIVIRAEKILSATEADPVGPAVIVVREGKISSVDPDSGGPTPTGAMLLSAKVVTPGLIDARTTLGLSGLIPVDDDRDEVSGPNQAHLRAIDAYNLREPMLEHALQSGVTLVQTGPGTANSIGGQTGIFKTHGSIDRGGNGPISLRLGPCVDRISQDDLWERAQISDHPNGQRRSHTPGVCQRRAVRQAESKR